MDRARPINWFHFLIGGFLVSAAMGAGSYLDVHLEEEAEADLRQVEEISGRDISRVGRKAREGNLGRTPDARPCAHVHQHSAKVLGGKKGPPFS